MICDLGVIIDRRGRTKGIRGNESAGKALDARAIEAVKHYRFRPATQDGKTVPVRMIIAVGFVKH